MKKKLKFKGTVKSIPNDIRNINRIFDNIADYNDYISRLMIRNIPFEASTEITESKEITLPCYKAIFDGTLENLLDEYDVNDFVAELAARLDSQLKIISILNEEEKCKTYDAVDDALVILNPQEDNDLIESFDKADDPRMQYKYYALVNFYHTLRFALA